MRKLLSGTVRWLVIVICGWPGGLRRGRQREEEGGGKADPRGDKLWAFMSFPSPSRASGALGGIRYRRWGGGKAAFGQPEPCSPCNDIPMQRRAIAAMNAPTGSFENVRAVCTAPGDRAGNSAVIQPGSGFFATFRALWPYLWPAERADLRSRVVAAFAP